MSENVEDKPEEQEMGDTAESRNDENPPEVEWTPPWKQGHYSPETLSEQTPPQSRPRLLSRYWMKAFLLGCLATFLIIAALYFFTDYLRPTSENLYDGIRDGDTVRVKLLLSSHPQLASARHSLDWPLHEAAEYNRIEIAQTLLAKGAEVNALASDNRTALDIANKKGYTEIADILRKAGGKERSIKIKEGDEK